MSFQCSGETLVPSEAAWLSSSLPNSPESRLARRRSNLRVPLERNVESWLSHTASELGEGVLVRSSVTICYLVIDSPRLAQPLSLP